MDAAKLTYVKAARWWGNGFLLSARAILDVISVQRRRGELLSQIWAAIHEAGVPAGHRALTEAGYVGRLEVALGEQGARLHRCAVVWAERSAERRPQGGHTTKRQVAELAPCHLADIDGAMDPTFGVVGAEHRPAHFSVVCEDGAVYVSMTYRQVHRLVMPADTTLPEGVVVPSKEEALLQHALRSARRGEPALQPMAGAVVIGAPSRGVPPPSPPPRAAA